MMSRCQRPPTSLGTNGDFAWRPAPWNAARACVKAPADRSHTLLNPTGQPPPASSRRQEGFEPWLKQQPVRVRKAVEAQGFRGDGYQLAILPGERDEWSAVLGVANADALGPWCLARAAESLPEGVYRVAGRGPETTTLGWLLGQYRFDRYKKEPSAKGARVLLTDEPARIARRFGRGATAGPRYRHIPARSRPADRAGGAGAGGRDRRQGLVPAIGRSTKLSDDRRRRPRRRAGREQR